MEKYLSKEQLAKISNKTNTDMQHIAVIYEYIRTMNMTALYELKDRINGIKIYNYMRDNMIVYPNKKLELWAQGIKTTYSQSRMGSNHIRKDVKCDECGGMNLKPVKAPTLKQRRIAKGTI